MKSGSTNGGGVAEDDERGHLVALLHLQELPYDLGSFFTGTCTTEPSPSAVAASSMFSMSAQVAP